LEYAFSPVGPISGTRSLDVSPETYAINRFIHDFGIYEGSLPVIGWVPALYDSERADPESCIGNIFPAVALASAAMQLQRHDLMVRAQHFYVNMLRTLAKTIEDPVKAKQDSVFVSVWLSGVYEVSTAMRDQPMLHRNAEKFAAPAKP
jgi:hypothetical protein